MAGSLSGPELDARAYEGMVAVAQRVQIGVGIVAVLALWLLDGVAATHKLTVTLLLACVYVPWTIFTPKMSRTSGRLMVIAIDILAIGVFALVIPETMVAVMSAYVLMVGFHAYVSGRTAGLVVSGGVLTLIGVAHVLAPASERLDSFTLLMYASVLIAFTVMLDGLAAERRALVRHLSRLHAAIEAVTSEPDLNKTLNSIASAAEDAVRAGFVIVLLEQDGRIDVKSQVTTRDLTEAATDDELQQVLDAILDQPGSTPSGLALSTREPVAVGDIRADARFAPWHPVAAKLGIASAVSVPFIVEGRRLGVLAAYWDNPNAFADDDVDLLGAYGRQAGLAVARALAYEREREAAQRLADADRVKSEFVARVSHELRTPLTAINGFISTVLMHWDQLDDTSKRDLLGRAGRNTTDLRRLVEQVLAFARTGDPQASMMARPLALAAEVDSLVAHLLPALGGHRVEVDVPASLVVHADREALNHVLTNLLTNAAKFSPEGTEIRVVARQEGGEIRLSISDEGPGIHLDEHARIFERFYRSSTVSAKGTGIGLSIVQSFVEQLGGRVWLESAPGAGATFFFTLPEGSQAGPPRDPASLLAR